VLLSRLRYCLQGNGFVGVRVEWGFGFCVERRLRRLRAATSPRQNQRGAFGIQIQRTAGRQFAGPRAVSPRLLCRHVMAVGEAIGTSRNFSRGTANRGASSALANAARGGFFAGGLFVPPFSCRGGPRKKHGSRDGGTARVPGPVDRG